MISKNVTRVSQRLDDALNRLNKQSLVERVLLPIDFSLLQDYKTLLWDPSRPHILYCYLGILAITLPYPRHPGPPPEVRYLDPKKIPKAPNLRRYDWMSRVPSPNLTNQYHTLPNWQYISLIYHLYTTYIPLIYHLLYSPCLLGGYMPPATRGLYRLQRGVAEGGVPGGGENDLQAE